MLLIHVIHQEEYLTTYSNIHCVAQTLVLLNNKSLRYQVKTFNSLDHMRLSLNIIHNVNHSNSENKTWSLNTNVVLTHLYSYINRTYIYKENTTASHSSLENL